MRNFKLIKGLDSYTKNPNFSEGYKQKNKVLFSSHMIVGSAAWFTTDSC